MKFSVIILAAGSGKRTGLKMNKVLLEINKKRVIDYSIEFFHRYEMIDQIILVVSKDEYVFFSKEFNGIVDSVVIGGSERQESVYLGLSKVSNKYVLIHDGARPFVPENAMNDIFSSIEHFKSMTLGVKVKDTIQEVYNNKVVKTLDRSKLIAVQTPQVFWTKEILTAHELARKNNFIGTDDTMLMERFLNIPAYIIEGDYRNLKLTTKEDIKFLEVIL